VSIHIGEFGLVDFVASVGRDRMASRAKFDRRQEQLRSEAVYGEIRTATTSGLSSTSIEQRARAISVATRTTTVTTTRRVQKAGKGILSAECMWKSSAAGQEPNIVVIDERVLVRDCFVQCLRLSYSNHAILAFSSLREWSKTASDRSKPSIVVLCTPSGRYAAAGNEEEIEFLARVALTVPVIVVSDAEDAQHIIKVLKNGARGYIPTSMTLDVAVEAVRLVKAGGTFVPASSLISNSVNGVPASLGSALTARQIMVLRALHSGKANKQIAYELNMCESTVKVHIRHIMRKLNARNRTQIAVKASTLLES
jgi:DNA-binding NarL/FixJ family response regulator